MLTIQDRIFLRMKLGDFDIPDNTLAPRLLLIQSDAKAALPTFQLEVEDIYGLLNNPDFVVLKDGLPVVITVGRTEQESETYNFRLFTPARPNSEINTTYKLTGYYNAPKYLFESSTEVFKGTSAEVIKTLAARFGFTYKGDPTSDRQNWYVGNRRFSNFARYICDHAYSGDRDLRVIGVTLTGEMRYLNYNRIQGGTDVLKLSYTPNEQRVYPINEHKVLDSPGFNNATKGYRYTLYEQDIERGILTYKDVELRKMATDLHINDDIYNSLKRCRIEHSPIHTDNVHDNFYKAYHANMRGYALNNSGLSVMTSFGTKRDLFDPVQVSLQHNTGAQRAAKPDRVYDGEYIIASKQVIVRGTNYAERFWLNRSGLNSI